MTGNSSKYFRNEGKSLIDEIMRRNSVLEKRVRDLEREVRNQEVRQPLPRFDLESYPTPYEGQRAIDIVDEQHAWYSDGEWRKAGGFAVYEIKIFEDENTVFAGDGIFYWPIPEDLDLAEIVKVEAGVSTPSTSGSVQIQLRHLEDDGATDSGDILTDKITIEANEKNSRQASVQPTITGGTRLIHHGDWIRCDIDAAGAGARGLALIVSCVPSPLGSVTLKGSKGDPGGFINWMGAWSSATTYAVNDAVSHNGSSYVARQASTDVEPGVDAGWETYWMLLAGGQYLKNSAFEVTINGTGYPIFPGIKTFLTVPFSATIVEATLLADVVGSCVVDIWKDTYGSFPPSDADSITGSTPLTLSSALKTTDTALTGWTTALAQGDVLGFNVDSISVIGQLTIALRVERN